MTIHPLRRMCALLALASALAACGTSAPSEAAQVQLDLAATAAAASPIPDGDSVVALAATGAALTPTTAPSLVPTLPATATSAATPVASSTVIPTPDGAATAQAQAAEATEVAAATGAAAPRASSTVAATRALAAVKNTATTVRTTATSAPATATLPPSITAAPATTTAVPPTVTTVPPTATAAPQAAPADDGDPVPISFTELYAGASITGPILSEKAKSLNGHLVVMDGYMAPPLMPNVDFFVLTRTPMVYCPFCNTAADWPFDIVFVRLSGGRGLPPTVPSQAIRVIGTFSTGTATDAATGFVSQVRIIADRVEIMQ